MTTPVVAVFGASGFVGSHLVSRLRQHDGVSLVLPRGPEGQRLDISADWQSLLQAIDGADVVVNAAGTAHSHSQDPAYFWPANATGARNVSRAVAHSTSCRTLVHVSSVAVGCGGVDPAVADFQPFTAYGASKAAGEWAATAELKGSGKALVIIRPAGIGGEGSPGAWGKIGEMVRADRRVPVPGSDVKHDVVEIADVAQTLVDACTGRLPAGTHALTGDRPVSVEDYARRVAAAYGKTARTVKVPRWMLAPVVTSNQIVDRSTRPLRRASQVADTLLNQRPLVTQEGRRNRY